MEFKCLITWMIFRCIYPGTYARRCGACNMCVNKFGNVVFGGCELVRFMRSIVICTCLVVWGEACLVILGQFINGGQLGCIPPTEFFAIPDGWGLG